MWFAIVGKRTFQGTTARTRSPVGEPGPAKQERLVVVEAVRLDELRASCPSSSSSSIVPCVGDLAAARRVERRLAELGEEETVLELLERAELGQHVGLRVADELGLEARARARSRRRAGSSLAPGCARDLPVPLHLGAVAVDVDRLAALLGELDGQLDGKAVRRGEREGILAGDPPLSGELLEQLQPPLERLAEALLLGAHDALDLVARCAAAPDRRRAICSTTTAGSRWTSSSPIRRACCTARRMIRRRT